MTLRTEPLPHESYIDLNPYPLKPAGADGDSQVIVALQVIVVGREVLGVHRQ